MPQKQQQQPSNNNETCLCHIPLEVLYGLLFVFVHMFLSLSLSTLFVVKLSFPFLEGIEWEFIDISHMKESWKRPYFRYIENITQIYQWKFAYLPEIRHYMLGAHL